MSQDLYDARSIATRRPDDDASTVRLDDDTSTIRGPGPSLICRGAVRGTANAVRNSIIKFAFGNILESSRVYKRTAHVHEYDQSFASSAARSVFTGHSLADISVLSVIAMPLCMVDVSNAQHYVTVGERAPEVLDEMELEVVNPASTNTGFNAETARQDQNRSLELHVNDEMANIMETLRVLEEVAQPEPLAEPISPGYGAALDHGIGRDNSPTSKATASRQPTPPNSGQFDLIGPALNRLHSHPGTLATLENALTDPDTESLYSLPGGLDDYEDGEPYACAGCDEV
jgi:hypothetical protein